MIAARSAIVAACLCWAALTAAGTLQRPLAVEFKLRDGVRITGQMTLWDAEGFNGSFGRRRWLDLRAADVWDLHQRIMDARDVDQWINLGRVLLTQGEGDRRTAALAERAFARALKLDPSAGSAVQQARLQASSWIQQQKDEQARLQRLTTRSPEAEPWPADPWPELTDEQAREAAAEMRRDALALLQRVQLDLQPIESEHYLLYTDAPRGEAAGLAMLLERLHGLLERTFPLPAERHQAQPADGGAKASPRGQGHGHADRPPGEPAAPPARRPSRGFWGKAVVFVFSKPEMFRRMESDVFGHLVPLSRVAVCHARDAKVFVNARGDDPDAQWALIIETVHGWMHRFGSPRRPPPWVNEGLAEYVAFASLPDSLLARGRRSIALQRIRAGTDLAALFDQSYEEDGWCADDGVAASIGALALELMIREQPARFARWIQAIKAGEEWRQALVTHMRLTPRQLADACARYYAVND